MVAVSLLRGGGAGVEREADPATIGWSGRRGHDARREAPGQFSERAESQREELHVVSGRAQASLDGAEEGAQEPHTGMREQREEVDQQGGEDGE